MTSPDDLPIDGPPESARDSARDDQRDLGDDESAREPGGTGEPDAPVYEHVEEHVEEPLDEEAAWRLIVENYGERVQLGGPAATGVFDRSYLDAVSRGSDPVDRPQDRPDDEAVDPADDRRRRRSSDRVDETEHFVPPEPPPVPRGTPARRLAWAGLFVPPLLMLLAVVLGSTFPGWAAFGLVAAFVGGFVFLVLTMPRDHGDGRDDGAVV